MAISTRRPPPAPPQSNERIYLEISSSPEPEDPFQPNAPPVRLAAKRSLASTLVSAPPPPVATPPARRLRREASRNGDSSFTSGPASQHTAPGGSQLTNGRSKATPNVKGKQKSRPVVPKHPPSTPMKVIELSDSSEEEDDRHEANGTSNTVDGAQANGAKTKGKGKAKALEEDEEHDDDDDGEHTRPSQAPSTTLPAPQPADGATPREPTPAPNITFDDAPFDDFYATDEDDGAAPAPAPVPAASTPTSVPVPAPVPAPAPAVHQVAQASTGQGSGSTSNDGAPGSTNGAGGGGVDSQGEAGEDEETTPKPRRTRVQANHSPPPPSLFPLLSQSQSQSHSQPAPSASASASSSNPTSVPETRPRPRPRPKPRMIVRPTATPSPAKTHLSGSLALGTASPSASPSPSNSRATPKPKHTPKPTPTPKRTRPSPLKQRASLVPHERHDITFLVVDSSSGEEDDDYGGVRREGKGKETKYERGLPRVEPMPFPLVLSISSSSSGVEEVQEVQEVGGDEGEKASMGKKGKGKERVEKAKEVKTKGKDVKEKGKGKGKARATTLSSEDEVIEEEDSLPWSPVPSRKGTRPIRSPRPASRSGRRPEGGSASAAGHAKDGGAGTLQSTDPKADDEETVNTGTKGKAKADDPWAYDLDDLDAEQLQAIAIAADAEDEVPHWLQGGGGEGVGGFGDGGIGAGDVGVGVGGADQGGEGGDVDEEMLRAIALAADLDEIERADEARIERERLDLERVEREDLERIERERASVERVDQVWQAQDQDLNLDLDPDAMDVDDPAVFNARLPPDEGEDPFLVQREVFDISSDGPEIPLDVPIPTPPADGHFPDIPPELLAPVEDPTTTAVASVLEMIPDVDPDHLLALVETHLPTYGPNQIVEFLVSHLFENPGYPRVEKGKGKGKAREVNAEGSASTAGKRKAGGQDAGGSGSAAKRPRIDYASSERENTGGPNYRECAVGALQTAFPLIPLPYLRKKLASLNGLYAPTHLAIREDEARVERGEGERMYKPKASASRGGAKGKGKEVAGDEVFEEERRWLEVFLEGGGDQGTAEGVQASSSQGGEANAVEEEDDDEELEDDGTFIECGCCFSMFPFDRMSACPDAHLFCRSCLRRYAETELGSQNCALKCMHTSGCTSLFPESELRRLLPPKLFALYERIKQQKELKAANLEGLEECPFCDWACVLEASKEEDRLFRCGNEDECGVVSCRLCRKKEHVPKTCKEAEEDKHLGGRVAIEEAMTRALMRRCPKCDKEFIKSDGCNKMTCPNQNCRALSCYVCKQAITGYDHFHQNDPRNAGGSSTNTKCPLWDSVDHRHDQEVKEAYKKAVDEYERQNPGVEVGKDFKVDLPKSPPKQPNALPAGYIDPHALGGGVQWGVLGGGFAGIFGGPMHIPPVVPPHLRLEPHERAVHEAQDIVRRRQAVLQTAAVAQVRAQEAERECQERLWGVDGVPPAGAKRRRGVPSANLTPDMISALKQHLSNCSVNRRAAEVRHENAVTELELAQQRYLALRDDLQQRRVALEAWREQQRQDQAQVARNADADRARLREMEREAMLAMEMGRALERERVLERERRAERERQEQEALRRLRQAQAQRARVEVPTLAERVRPQRRQPATRKQDPQPRGRRR